MTITEFSEVYQIPVQTVKTAATILIDEVVDGSEDLDEPSLAGKVLEILGQRVKHLQRELEAAKAQDNRLVAVYAERQRERKLQLAEWICE